MVIQEQPQNVPSVESPTTPTADAEALVSGAAEAAAGKDTARKSTINKSSSDHTVGSGMGNTGEESSL